MPPTKTAKAPDDGESDWYAIARRRLNRVPGPNSLQEAARFRYAQQILRGVSEITDIEPPKVWVDTLAETYGNPQRALHICFWNGPDQSLEFYVFDRHFQTVQWRAMQSTVSLRHWGYPGNVGRDMMAWLYPDKNKNMTEAMMELAGKVRQ